MVSRKGVNQALGHARDRFSRGVSRFIQTSLGLLFPPRCTYCEAELGGPLGGLLLCDPCRETLGRPDWRYCPRCGAGLASDTPQSEGCDHCRTAHLRFDAAISLGAYREPLRDAVLKMKHPAGKALAAAMGRLLLLRRAGDLSTLRPDLVLPVPMHWRRRMAQGMNSPDLLAESLARHLDVPVVARLLTRCRNTPPQANLSLKQRFANIRGAFAVRADYDLGGAHILLVDDILTTGATCSEAARMLKAAGAARITVAVLARATGEDRRR